MFGTSSIYLMHRETTKLLRLTEQYRRYLPQFQLFDESREDVKFFYEVTPGEKERGWGWEYARNVVGEHYPPKYRTGWYSMQT